MSDAISETENKSGFVTYVFSIDEHNKKILYNIIQYTLLSVIPIVIILKLTRNFVPDLDESKSSLEISLEAIFQLLFIVVSFWFINRIIEYIPTWSGMEYDKFNNLNSIISFVFILLTMQTKLGDKIRLLIERIENLWDGKETIKKEDKNKIRVKQPLAGGQPIQMQAQPMHNMELPQYQVQSQQTQEPQEPNFDAMYQGPNNPIHGDNPTGPVPANEAFSSFGTW